MTRPTFLTASLALALAACGGGDGGDYTLDDIDPGDLAGMIGGAEWKMVEPLVEVDSFDDTRLSVTVYAEDIEDCGGFSVTSDLPFVLFSIPRETGEYPLSFSFSDGQTVTLVEPPAMNNIAAEGIIELTVDGDEVDFGMVAYADEGNQVNGRFSATVCPEETF